MEITATGEVHGGIGLAALRAATVPTTLVTTASDHVSLRTPSRVDHDAGNALHLLRPPDDLGAWLDRCDSSVGALPGYRGASVSWEVRGAAPDVDVPDGVDLHPAVVVELDLAPVGDVAGLDVVEVATPEQLAGARVLYLHTDWTGDEPYWRWLVDQQWELVQAGRGRLFVAYRHGIPAGRVGVFDDRGGLAIVSDLVVHPLHRGQGLAAHLLARAVTAAAGRAIAVVGEPALVAPVLRRGQPRGTVLTARRSGASTAGASGWTVRMR